MGPHFLDDFGDRDLRRLHLTKRLVIHSARTETIYRLTGYTRHRLTTLRKRWPVSYGARHRGPAPTSFAVFFRSASARSEAASAAAICRVFDAISAPRPGRAPRGFADLDSGERLCEVYEAFHACFPGAHLEFEQLLLLAVGLTRGDVVELTTCANCQCAILVDLLGRRRRMCSVCQRLSKAARVSTAGNDTPSDNQREAGPESVQKQLFAVISQSMTEGKTEVRGPCSGRNSMSSSVQGDVETCEEGFGSRI